MQSTQRPLLKVLLLSALASLLLSTSTFALYECPPDINDLSPQPGAIYIKYANNGKTLKIRESKQQNQIEITAPFKKNMRIYYVAKPNKVNGNMLFSLSRTYKIKEERYSGLAANKIVVSKSCVKINRNECKNKKQSEKYKLRVDFEDLHKTKDLSSNSLILAAYHLRFFDNRTSPTSYNNVEDTSIYNPENWDNFDGAKARMIRHRNIPESGKCIYYELFDEEQFASNTKFMQSRLIALDANNTLPSDVVDILVNAQDIE